MVRFELRGLPPSSNHAYFNLPRGGRTLTAVGKRYKTETRSFIARHYAKEMPYFTLNADYTFLFRFTFLHDDFYNKTFGKKGGSDSLYKRVDISNRVKLLEDSIKDATAIDDSCTTLLLVQKVPGPQELSTVLAWKAQLGPDPFRLLIEQAVSSA